MIRQTVYRYRSPSVGLSNIYYSVESRLETSRLRSESESLFTFRSRKEMCLSGGALLPENVVANTLGLRPQPCTS